MREVPEEASLSRSRLMKMIADGDVTLDGVWISPADLSGWSAALGQAQRDTAGHRQIPQLAPGSIREGETLSRAGDDPVYQPLSLGD